jgi:hypothetical protein
MGKPGDAKVKFVSVVALVVALVTGAAAAPGTPPPGGRWMHSAAGAENTARYREGSNEVVLRCLGGAIELVWYIDLRALESALRGRTTAFFAMEIGDQTLWFEGRLIADATTTSIGVGTRTANDFAHFIAAATSGIGFSLLTTQPSVGAFRYNRVQVPIDGAADAIKAAYAGCGIPW